MNPEERPMMILKKVFFLAVVILVVASFSFSFSGCGGCQPNVDLGQLTSTGSQPTGGCAGPVAPGGLVGPANLGANDIAAWDIWFEVNGQRTNQPTVGVPGNLVLDVINSFQIPVTVHIQWIENNNLLFEDNYPIPVGESTVPAGWMFNIEGERTIMAKISLVAPIVAEDPANNQASALIWPQAAGGNPPGGGQTQGVDLTWEQVVMTDAAGQDVREPVVGVPVNIIASSRNNGDTTALNITRSFSMNGAGGNDNVPQCAPGQCTPYVIHGYTFFQPGPNTFTLTMSGFSPAQAANARGTNPLTVTVNVLPAGAPPAGGGRTQGVDLGWGDFIMTDANGREVREPTAGVPVNIFSVTVNSGDTTTTGISRFLNIDGQGVLNDAAVQCAPGQNIPFFKNDYVFNQPGQHQVTLSMTGFRPAQAANARNNPSPAPILVNVLPAGANPPSASQGVDLTWADFVLMDADGHEVREPVVGEPVRIISVTTNLGDTAAHNISRFLNIDGQGVHDDHVDHCAPRENIRFVKEHYVFNQAGPHTLTFSMTGFNPAQAPNARGLNPAVATINVREGGLTVIPSEPPSASVYTDESHDLRFGDIGYAQYGYTDAEGHFHEFSTDESAVIPNLPGDFRGFVANDTNYNESNVGVTIKVNGRTIPGGNVTVAEVPANDHGWFQVPYKFTQAGSYKVTYDLDPQNRIQETNENNNHKESIVNVQNSELTTRGGRNDLACLNVQFNQYSPTEITRVGDPVTQTTVGRKGALVGTFYNTDHSPVYAIASLYVDGQLAGPAQPVANEPYRPVYVRVEDYSFATPGIHKMKLTIAPLPGNHADSDSRNSIERDIKVVEGFRILEPMGREVSLVPITPPPTGAPTGPVCDLKAQIPTFWYPGRHIGNKAYVGEQGYVEFKVYNKKDGSVDNTKVHIKVTTPRGAVLADVDKIVNVPANHRDAVGRVDLPALTETGPHTMYVVVDPAPFQKNDTNRDNNSEDHGFTVMGANVATGTENRPMMSTSSEAADCDLVADDVSFWVPGVNHSVSRIMVGQRGWVSYTVRNRKKEPLDAVFSEVRFLLNGQLIAAVPATLNIPATGKAMGKNDVPAFTTPGMYKMALVVDPFSRKKDIRRSDNTLTRSLRVDAYQAATRTDTSSAYNPVGSLLPGILDTVFSAVDRKHKDSSPPASTYNPPAQSTSSTTTTTTTSSKPKTVYTVKTQS